MTLQKMNQCIKCLIYSTVAVLLSLSLYGCAGNKAAESDVQNTPLPTQGAVISDVQVLQSASPFNPLYDFYSKYNAFTSKQLYDYVDALEETDTKTLLKLSEHLYATTLPMNTVGLLISSGEDYYGDLFDGFEGTGSMLAYDDKYEFSYDFSNSERLWGTFEADKLTFYKSISGSENYLKMTLEKTSDGYTSSCRTEDGSTILTVTSNTVVFE